jgi:hypothetical protein
MPEEWRAHNNYYPIYPGTYNSINPEPWAISWARPRFINTNPNYNNQDKFQYFRGIGGGGQSPNNPIFTGQTDTTMNWIHKTWSGKQTFGRSGISNSHYVEAKLTRNGIQIDTIIPYFVPPFDTSIVEIRY